MLKYQGNILKIANSTVDYVEPQHDPIVDTFYYLTYFYKNPDGTIRTYQGGQRVDTMPTANMSYYKDKTETFGTGTVHYVSSTTRSNSGYTANYSLTSDQQNFWKTGAVQYEYILHYTAWGESGTIIPLESFAYTHKLDYQSSRFEFLIHCSTPTYPQNSITKVDNRWSTFTNYEWVSFQSSSSNWPAGTYHLVCTLDIANKRTLFWINGKLQGKVYWKDAFITNRINDMATNSTLQLNTANLASTVWISQLGVRPAVYVEERDYDELAKPYLSTEEYY